MAKVGRLQDALNQKGKEVEDYARFVRKFEPKYREALSDRARFEAERDLAVKQAAESEKKVARVEIKLEKMTLSKQLEDLHERSNSDNPEVAQAAKAQVAEHDLKTANEAAVRKLKLANEQVEHVQNRWRDTSIEAATLRQEVSQLQLRIRDLESRANDNCREINRMNMDGQRRQMLSMYDQEHSMRLDREREIERKNEEIRSLKARFGGRGDTRGSSVPRSPRMRQMSSRNTSPVGDIGGSGSGGIGTGGLGPRGSHLRDG